MRTITFAPLTPDSDTNVRIACLGGLRRVEGFPDVGLLALKLATEAGTLECPDEFVSQVCSVLREHTTDVKTDEPIKGYLSGDGLLVPQVWVNPLRRSIDYQSRGRKTPW